MKKCIRCGDTLPTPRTNQHYCPHCADVAEFERRDIRLQSPALRRAHTLRRISMSKLRHRLPLPLEIDCAGLSGKLIRDLAARLSLHFVDVKLSGTDITAGNPLNQKHYDAAWNIIDRFGVKAR